MPARPQRGNGDADSTEIRPAFSDRLHDFFLKPAAEKAVDDTPTSKEELEGAVKSTSDKERLIGFLGAPFAAAIAILITNALVANDPSKYLSDGALNKSYVNPNLYREVDLVLLALSIVMLLSAWRRKRLYLGMSMALYGLAVFNLHYWGFGVPYIMCAAWLLVRSYRLQRDLKEVTGGGTVSRAGGSRPTANKRYTPPSSRGLRRRSRPSTDDLSAG